MAQPDIMWHRYDAIVANVRQPSPISIQISDSHNVSLVILTYPMLRWRNCVNTPQILKHITFLAIQFRKQLIPCPWEIFHMEIKTFWSQYSIIGYSCCKINSFRENGFTLSFFVQWPIHDKHVWKRKSNFSILEPLIRLRVYSTLTYKEFTY